MTREKAIEIIKKCKEKRFKHTFYTVNEYDAALDMAIKALEQEPCEDAISRQAVLDLIADYDLSMGQVVKGVHALPPVTPQQKIGHWIFVDKAKEHAHCSECDYGNVDLMDGRPHNYCPNCGVKMVETRESVEV